MSEPSEPENEKQDAGDVVSGDVVSDGVVTGDADWKAKAQREKEELDKTLDSEERPELPPASFLGLVEELSLRSMIALGQIPNPLTGKQDTDLEAARYTIDLLGVLEEKTKGNLEASEAQAVTDVVAQLRMVFVHLKQHGTTAGTEPEEPEEPEEPPGPKLIV